jgi:hypothetical protein
VKAGQSCSFQIILGEMGQQWLKRCGGVRKGMVLLDTLSKPHASWTFCAEIWGLDGREQVIKNNSTVVINSDHIR